MPKRLTHLLSRSKERLPKTLPKTPGFWAVSAFSGASVIAVLAAWAAAVVIENRSEMAVNGRLMAAGITWAKAQSDGLQVQLVGTAPNEAARFRAVNLAGTEVDAARVRDALDVTPVKAIEAPKFSLEMLRNDDGIQLIGLLPADGALDTLKSETDLLADSGVSDMLETADYPAPDNWGPAFRYGLDALKKLPRSKVSVSTGRVVITAIADSAAEQRSLEQELEAARPSGIFVRIDISAPRPVITPFTLRFVLDEQGGRFDACSADTDRARIRILAAGSSAGSTGQVTCPVGLGVPSPSWAEAVARGIGAVKTLGAATITFSDADVSLVAPSSIGQRDFDRVVGELQSALPEVFSLKATLEKKADGQQGPAEFTATRSSDGKIELRGRLTDAMLRDAVASYAKARFGVGNVMTATRLDEDLPDGWSVRVLAGLEALAEIAEGNVLVQEDLVTIEGVTGSQVARGRISQILSGKLGQGERFRVSVRYDEELDPLAALPSPAECAVLIDKILSKRKISFSPGSVEIDNASSTVMDDLAIILKDCPNLEVEIGGHTDSQGSEEGNRALSQARAESVLLALQGRGVNITTITAKGYGESNPIAENRTEEGREANRRIEFKVLTPTAPAPTASASAAAEEGAASAEAPAPAAASAAGDAEDDDSPSVAPKEKTRRPVARPATDR